MAADFAAADFAVADFVAAVSAAVSTAAVSTAGAGEKNSRCAKRKSPNNKKGRDCSRPLNFIFSGNQPFTAPEFSEDSK
jgi:hypothetical protein